MADHQPGQASGTGGIIGPGAGRLAGKAAVVTGATSGIGAVVAARLHAEGARVLLTGRDRQRGGALAASLGEPARFFAADLTEPAAPAGPDPTGPDPAGPDPADRVIAACVEAFGTVDILVNNAAVDHVGDLVRTPMGEIRATFELNTFAVIRLLQAAAGVMTEGGSIVNVTSRLASIGVPTMAIYSASKGAIRALTRAAAVELAPRGIRVNDVAPGMTRTPLYDAWLASLPDPGEAERHTVSAIPLGRLADPADVAAAVCYLASDDARYVTGTSIAVDGGYTAQ